LAVEHIWQEQKNAALCFLKIYQQRKRNLELEKTKTLTQKTVFCVNARKSLILMISTKLCSGICRLIGRARWMPRPVFRVKFSILAATQ
jgi:hypothetical protein